jgi:hypothetical protein
METMTATTTDKRVDELSKRVDFGFEQVDRRFEQVNRRIDDANAANQRDHDRMDMEIRELRADMKAEFTAVRGETKDEFRAVRGEMKEGFDSVHAQMARFQTLAIRFFGGTLATIVAGVAVTIVSSHL